MGRLESQGKVPAQTEHNLKHNVSMISLRSGKSYEDSSRFEYEKEAKKVEEK